jgi:SAM-dependent methyltransferase
MTLSRVDRKRRCPICDSHESRPLFHQTFEPLSGIEFLEGYDVVVCAQCGLAFADGIPDQAALDAYYRDLSKYEYVHQGGKESELDEQRFRDIAATIQPFLAADSRVLEIGCATGRLLALLRDAGFGRVQGLDPSPGCARAAWDLYGVPVFVDSMFSIPAPEASFDFVILIGVLEHVEDLRGALKHVRDVLSPAGRVYAEVPDAANLAGRPDAPYQEFSTEHINFFSRASLANLFQVTGFELLMTGESVRQQHDNTTTPAAFGVFRKAESVAQLTRDEVTERGLRRYIEESAAVEAHVRIEIGNLSRGEPLIVWGTGTHTQRLLAAGAFRDVRIAAFVDSNPKYHGRQLHGIPVIGPSSLAERKERILISTRGYQSEIEDQIRRQLGLDNEIILLYPSPSLEP